MQTLVAEIAPQIYRFSTWIDSAGIVFNQFLIDAEEPLLFHTGQHALYPTVRAALARVIDPARLRWIAFGHYEADESGAMNDWLETAPEAVVAHGAIGVRTSIRDQAIREPRTLADGEVLDLGGKRVRYLSTPHVPHGWDAGLIYEETTQTLFTSDLFTRRGRDFEAVSDADIVEPALTMEDAVHASALTPATAPTMRRLAEMPLTTLALMHGPAYNGDCGKALRDLADAYAERLAARA
jgi:flavorubredoxin